MWLPAVVQLQTDVVRVGTAHLSTSAAWLDEVMLVLPTNRNVHEGLRPLVSFPLRKHAPEHPGPRFTSAAAQALLAR